MNPRGGGTHAALVVVVFLSALALAHRGRQWNFDALGYAAAAVSWSGATEEDAHRRVYDDLRAVASPAQWTALTASSEYRTKLAAEPRALATQVPFYASKPLLVGLSALAARAGLNVIEVVFVIPAIAWAAFVALLVGWLLRSGGGVPGVLLALGFATSPIGVEAGQLATPDSLAALFLLVGARGVVTRSVLLTAVGFALACATRADAALLAVALLAWTWWRMSARWAPALAAGLVLFVAVTQSLAQARSWSALFIHTFVRRLTVESDFESVVVTSSDYFRVLRAGLGGDFVLHPSVALFVLGLSALVARQTARWWLLAVWSALVLHVLAFPMLADRFFLAHYALVLVAAASRSERLD